MRAAGPRGPGPSRHGGVTGAMTSSGPYPGQGNPFEPPRFIPPAPPDQGAPADQAPAGANPLTQPDLFVRPPRPPSPWRQRLIGLGVVAALVACCGGLVYTVSGGNDDKPKAAAVAASASASPRYSYTYSPPPTVTRTTPPPTSPPPPPSPTGLDGVKESDCLKNTGTDEDPHMVPTPCARGTYKVLKRLYGTINTGQCQTVRGSTATYTVTYYRNGIPDFGLSYVFCLKKL
jgi:hypothetical protein